MTVQHRPPEGKYKLTVDDFMRLDETGVFGTSRTELLDGEIIIMNAEYRPHGRVRDELHYRLRRKLEELGSDLLPIGASVWVSDHNLPLPDIALTSAPRGEGAIPLSSLTLVVEVASTTLRRDMGRKLRMYARAGVPEYLVADVSARVVHRMWSPSNKGYANRDEIAFGERLGSATIDGLSIDTSAL